MVWTLLTACPPLPSWFQEVPVPSFRAATQHHPYHFRMVNVTNLRHRLRHRHGPCDRGGLPPVVMTGTASASNSAGAVLRGTVNASGLPTLVVFEYGTSTNYSSTNNSAPPATITGNTDTQVSAAATGLTANSTCHYRIVAINSQGITYGAGRHCGGRQGARHLFIVCIRLTSTRPLSPPNSCCHPSTGRPRPMRSMERPPIRHPNSHPDRLQEFLLYLPSTGYSFTNLFQPAPPTITAS